MIKGIEKTIADEFDSLLADPQEEVFDDEKNIWKTHILSSDEELSQIPEMPTIQFQDDDGFENPDEIENKSVLNSSHYESPDPEVAGVESDEEVQLELSEEELENVLADGTLFQIDSLDREADAIDMEDDPDFNMDISTSSPIRSNTQSLDIDSVDDELENALSDIPALEDEEPASNTQESFFKEDVDEGPIALSDDELENALSDIPALEDEEPASNTQDSFFKEDVDEGPIALSDDELDEISMSEEFKKPSPGRESHSEEDFVFTDTDLSSPDADMDIQVINDEKTLDEEPTNEEFTEQSIMEDNKVLNEEENDDWEINISPEDYKSPEIKPEEFGDTKPEANPESQPVIDNTISDDEGQVNFYDENPVSLPNRDDLRKVVAYLDNLLGELPDDMIEKFARSEYFKLYQKVMDDLGL
ncbi:MAG: hypothetical protein OEV66_01340 [Spirochaetia bacterium]|nr:hypothetical protein [Spirochaetia bacterium]